MENTETIYQLGYDPTFTEAQRLKNLSGEELKNLGFIWIPFSGKNKQLPPIDKGCLVVKNNTWEQVMTLAYNTLFLSVIADYSHWLGKVKRNQPER